VGWPWLTRERASLWKRAAWHAVKTLVRKHPRAALSAATAGSAYAVKSVAKDSAEAIKSKLMLTGEEATAVPSEIVDRMDQFSAEEKAEFVDSLSPSDQRTLLQTTSDE
jgi:hypothetical protein